MRRILLKTAIVLASAFPCTAQARIGAIDFFAYEGADIEAIRTSLSVHLGDEWTTTSRAKVESDIQRELGRRPSEVFAVCCDDKGDRLVYIGLGDGSNSRITLNAEPQGTSELSDELLSLYAEFDHAIERATERGGDGIQEDDSRGYPLFGDPGVRAMQLRIREYALRNSAQLFAVSRTSSNSKHRAVATDAIGYAIHSIAQVAALTHAVLDPDKAVRNNAIRALAVLARSDLELKAPIPHGIFVDLIASESWEDRNKSLAVLSALTQSRDPAILAAIRSQSLDALIECARWTWSGHATWPRVILARIAGLDEETLFPAASHAAIVDAALAKLGNTTACCARTLPSREHPSDEPRKGQRQQRYP